MRFVARIPKSKIKPPEPPKSDPRFQRVAGQVRRGATTLKKHPPAKKKANEAQAAAKPPLNEKLAGAKANQVDSMKAAKAEKPKPNAFLALLRAEIKKVMPANLDEAGSFMDSDKKAELEGAVTGKVNEQKDDATGEIKAASTKSPDTGKVPGKAVTSMPADPAVPTPLVQGNRAMPAPKPETEITQQQNKVDAQQMMDDAEITEPQMKKANDPRFSAVLTAKSSVAKIADASPAKYRAGEKGVLGRAMAQAQLQAKRGVASLLGVKKKSGVSVKSQQELAKEKDEKRRKEVADTIEGIYTETKRTVDTKLSTLDSQVMSTFDRGVTRNLTALKEDTRQEIEDYKDERYSGIRGKGRWLADKFRPLVPGVKSIIQRHMNLFTEAMDALIVQIADLVETKLDEAKKEIDKGQTRIKTYVASLPKDLQAVGKAAEKEVSSRFDEMRRGVEDKQNDLAQKLAAKYKEAQDQATAIAKKIEEENKGAIYKLAEAIGEIVKILSEFKDKLMAALRKGWSVIKQIISDPIGFLSNLLAAIKQGFSQFRERFLVHLERGFIKWLFGAMAGSGVELPKDLSLPSILKMVMQVLGLTYERLRTKAVKLIGERNVAMLEKVFEYIKALITEGPAALWEKIKADLSNLKDMVIGEIQKWILTQIIKSAVTKLLTMFNPVGAIIQALITIYNTVMFVIENASRLIEFVEAVLNSVSEIASGAIAKAANWIETALGNMIPIVIGFLARLIGLGGIADAVVGIIKKVQGVVDRAIDKVLEKVVGTVKKLFSGKGEKPTPGQPVAARQAAKPDSPAKPGQPEAPEELHYPDEKFSAGAESHRIWVRRDQDKVEVMISSETMALREFLRRAIASPNIPDANKEGVPRAVKILDKMDKTIENLEKAKRRGEKVRGKEKALNKLELDLAEIFRAILNRVSITQFKEIYKLEGLVGTYATSPVQTRDDMTPDHQPQAEALKSVAALPVFSGRRIQAAAAGKQADGGVTINIQDKRHKAGRTWGTKGSATAAGVRAKIAARVIPLAGNDEAQREEAIKILREELEADVVAMKAVASRPNTDPVWVDINNLTTLSPVEKDELINQVRVQIHAGEDRIKGQRLGGYKDV